MSQERKISEADCLKKLDSIFEPDPRNLKYEIYDEKLRRYRPFTFEDHYRTVEELKLHEGVPDDVFIQFEKARNLYLYTWFFYRFEQIVEMQAYAVTEFALRVRYGGNTRKTLKPLLDHAVKNGWLKNEGFRGYQRKIRQRERDLELIDSEAVERLKEEKKGSYVGVLAKTLPSLRNIHAHGGPTLHPNSYTTLEICCDIINQLFESN